jgi:hypothetical protein
MLYHEQKYVLHCTPSYHHSNVLHCTSELLHITAKSLFMEGSVVLCGTREEKKQRDSYKLCTRSLGLKFILEKSAFVCTKAGKREREKKFVE